MIAYCGCTKATSFKVHCGTGSTSQAANPKPTVKIDYPGNAAALYQDARYGQGNRVHNPVKTKPNEQKMGRCSVCSTTRAV
jgi:hypothetical protein